MADHENPVVVANVTRLLNLFAATARGSHPKDIASACGMLAAHQFRNLTPDRRAEALSNFKSALDVWVATVPPKPMGSA